MWDKYKTKKEKEEKKATDKEKIELAEIIYKAKATYQTFGFEQAIDKFSDYTLNYIVEKLITK